MKDVAFEDLNPGSEALAELQARMRYPGAIVTIARLAFLVGQVPFEYLEAILAVSAIIIWHFFYVLWMPSEYPMSTIWLDG